MDQLKLTMLEVENNLSGYQMYLLGRIEAARSNFKFQEARVKEAQEEYDRLESGSGFVEHVAEHFRRVRENKLEQVGQIMIAKGQAEKFYRKMKHEAIEGGISEDFIRDFVMRRNAEDKQ